MKKEHEEIIELCFAKKNSSDEIEADFVKDMVLCALNYTDYRVKWNYFTPEERDANNAPRSRCHNRFIDTLNIFLRYEKERKNVEVPDVSGYDRKEIGDIANELVCRFAIAMR